MLRTASIARCLAGVAASRLGRSGRRQRPRSRRQDRLGVRVRRSRACSRAPTRTSRSGTPTLVYYTFELSGAADLTFETATAGTRPRHGALPLSADRRSLGLVPREERRRRRREVLEARRSTSTPARIACWSSARRRPGTPHTTLDRELHRRGLYAAAARLHAAGAAHRDAGAVRRTRPVADTASRTRSTARRRRSTSRCICSRSPTSPSTSSRRSSAASPCAC